MDLEEIKALVDDATASTDATREQASEMLVFGRIDQWADDIADDVQTEFRGTFDLIKPKRNKILAELWANPVSVTFKPKDGAEPEAAETLTGMFRTDMLKSEEATETALQDQVDCGFGAFRFVTQYESKFDDLNNYQRIHAEPIDEANNVVYWDANAKRKDKSDARWGMVITSFTEKGWQRYCEEDDIDHSENENPESFKQPNQSGMWFWKGGKTGEIKVGEFYAKTKKRERVLFFEDPLGQVKAVYQREVKEVLDEMIEAGFQKVGEKLKERWVVHKYIVSGEKIIKETRIPGEHIPIIAVYGDHSRVEGREIWRGIYHDAQDPQRLHNFMMSYMADIVAKGPREKPIYYPGQIQGFEYMYTQNGADNNFPYLLQNEISQETGQPYPVGAVGALTPPQLPQAAQALLEYTRQAVDGVTGGMLDTDQMLSGAVTEGQIRATQTQQNLETFLYQNSYQLAMKHAGRVYASMAAELYDVPRTAVVTQPDGTETEVEIMEAVFDEETGEEVIINDITRGSFEVYADVGPAYQTQKDQARRELMEMYSALQGTPEGQIVLLTYMSLMDGPKMDDLRKYARKQLILQGIMEPDTEEEQQMLMEAQQAQNNQQPDANMLLAMAEMEKAKADQMNAQSDAQDDAAKRQVDAYNAETKRLEAIARARKAGVETNKLQYEIRGTELDNIQKLKQAMMPQSVRVQ